MFVLIVPVTCCFSPSTLSHTPLRIFEDSSAFPNVSTDDLGWAITSLWLAESQEDMQVGQVVRYNEDVVPSSGGDHTNPSLA